MKIKILFFASNPSDTPRLALDEEIRAIDAKIRAADYRDVLGLLPAMAARPDDLLQKLNEHKPQIVHFSGHGSQAGEIILMDQNRQAKPVSAAALKMLFTTLKDNIRCVVLNACFSRVQSEAIVEVIDCVIGMSDTIGDEAAITFASSFYRAIGFGRSIQDAFDQGTTAILLEGIAEEDIPQLLVRSGVNPSSIVLLGGSPEERTSEDTLAEIYEQMPASLKELVDSGSEFIDIPSPIPARTVSYYMLCELRMRQTSAVFVIRVHKLMKIKDAAEYLVERVLPHLRSEDYVWSFDYKGKRVPSSHTFATSGIRAGDIVYLHGDHRLPSWRPGSSYLDY